MYTDALPNGVDRTITAQIDVPVLKPGARTWHDRVPQVLAPFIWKEKSIREKRRR